MLELPGDREAACDDAGVAEPEVLGETVGKKTGSAEDSGIIDAVEPSEPAEDTVEKVGKRTDSANFSEFDEGLSSGSPTRKLDEADGSGEFERAPLEIVARAVDVGDCTKFVFGDEAQLVDVDVALLDEIESILLAESETTVTEGVRTILQESVSALLE